MTRTQDPLLSAVAGGVRLFELGQPFFTGMPCSPNHPGFRMTLIRRHGDMLRPDGGSAANEIIVTGGHVGTHIDALSHVSHDGKLHGDVDAAQAQQGGVFTTHGAENLPGLLRRGVLLDVAAVHGVATLDAATASPRPTWRPPRSWRAPNRVRVTWRWYAPVGRVTSMTSRRIWANRPGCPG